MIDYYYYRPIVIIIGIIIITNGGNKVSLSPEISFYSGDKNRQMVIEVEMSTIVGEKTTKSQKSQLIAPSSSAHKPPS
jgi:hypothetical protein